MKNHKYSHIIWDWNGTLLDDVECGIAAVNQMLSKRGLKMMNSREDYFKLFTFPVINYYKKLGFNFKEESFEDLSVEYINNYINNFQKLSNLHENALCVLEKIKNSEMCQIIISASEQKLLREQTNAFKISNLFNEILGINNIYASGKIDIAQNYIKKNSIKKALLIGDTLHDYEVSLSIKADCALIPNGHSNRKSLLKTEAVLLDNISQIPNFIGI